MRQKITNPDLHRLADELGVALIKHDGGGKGYYIHELRLITTRRGLSIAEYRSTLAHELAHAHYQDAFSTPKIEARADRWAANYLLDEHDVRDALIWHNHHRSPAAYDLEVTEHLLDVWLENYERKAA
ncbi:ImmA/IrrE family metallo-endopeptidase [uncultured Corynebacterium sp.]|uniref:ImmA/IrrE family metallo-endopeptidase n=1 Tax=uncultured Corynebacterium sp. TaxID=159447 RepID=UPI0025918B90|nr:ImmA/IrrE family metallo-endopeptidase [uncultured Corynebacterium sp.]